jgi:dTDP-4-dehydrorhamnose reductase
LTKVFHSGLPLLRLWVASLRAGQAIEAFADMVCAPVALDSAVRGIAAISERALGGRWQFSPGSDIAYADVAGWIVRRLGAEPALLRPVSAAGAPGIEHLPRHTTLEAGRAGRELGLDFAEANQVLASCWTT